MTFQDRVAQKLRERNSEVYFDEEYDNTESDIEQFVSSPYFGIDQLRNHPSCLDLRLANGTFKALPYSYIIEIDYDPSEGIEIMTTTKKISITGRNLKLLYFYLSAYRVKFIKANIGNDVSEEEELFVREVKVEEM